MFNKEAGRCDKYLTPTFFLDSDSSRIKNYAAGVAEPGRNEQEKAILLFNAVRDDIVYDLFGYEVDLNYMKASCILDKASGYCVSKALVLASCARSVGIPARLGFADVINHLMPKKLLDLMRTEVFAFHGFAELFINGRWVKATPSFDSRLCEKMGYFRPEFDGVNDTVYPSYDKQGNRHMEYVHYYGSYPDLPVEDLMASVRDYYPHFFGGEKLDGRYMSRLQGIDYDIIVPDKDMKPVPPEYPRDIYQYKKAG